MPSVSQPPPANLSPRYHGWTKKVCNMPLNRVTSFGRVVVLIIDDVTRGGDEHRELPDRGADEHRRKCIYIYELFTNCFRRCEVISVRMQPHDRERQFTQFIEQQLRQLNSGDLAIFYFHGAGGEERKDYTWTLRGPGPNKINAYNLIEQANRSAADCLFILDCWVPTRFKSAKWKREHQMTELYIAGAPMHNGDGRTIQGPQNYTEALCRTLRGLRTEPDSRPNRKSIAAKTLHELMKSDKTLATKPMRICTSMPAEGSNKRVWRFVIEPEFVMRDGKLEFYKCEIQNERTNRGLRLENGGDGNDDNEGGGNGGGRNDDHEDEARNHFNGDSSDGGNNGGDSNRSRRDVGRRHGIRGSKRARSYSPNDNSSKKLKTSPSPFTGKPIKREPTDSPGPEVTSENLSQFMRGSTRDDAIDLVAEEEQSLFISSNDNGN